MHDAYDDYRATRIFGSLDGLRCLSILAVVWHHTAPGVAALPMSRHGFLGVDMFFVLSGFLIVTLLLRERDVRGRVSLRDFYVRRALRIFPPYYGLLLVLTAYLGLVAPNTAMAAPFFAELPYHLTYTSNWIRSQTLLEITWSLAAEEQFYLFWPPVERLAAAFAIPIVLVVVAVNQALNFGLLDGWLEDTLGLRFTDLSILQATFTPICLGVLLAHALHARRGFAAVHARLGGWWSSAACLAAVVALANWPGDLRGAPRLAIQAAMALLLASCVLRERHALAGFLATPLVRRIGIVSYGMYLYHLLARHAAGAAFGLGDGVALFAATLVVTIAMAEASYRLYETPFLRLKARYAGRR